MTSPERLAALQTYRSEFYNEATTDERRIEIIKVMQTFAAEENMPRCINCRQPGVAVPYEHGLVEGHCYSDEGITEFTRISGCCEFCYDKMFKEPDEDEPYIVDPDENQAP